MWKIPRAKGSFFSVLLLLTALFCLACSAEQKAAEIYDIASFEELQTNTAHARELYQEIIEKYPNTETAHKAYQALDRLRDTAEEKW